MMRNHYIEELELTASDIEFAHAVYQRPAVFTRPSESEVARMRERIEHDREIERRFDALRMKLQAPRLDSR